MYYSTGAIETIDIIHAKLTPSEYIGFLRGNVIKYLSRAGRKVTNGSPVPANEDYAKAYYYMELLAETNDVMCSTCGSCGL